jgi:hypothetical protein
MARFDGRRSKILVRGGGRLLGKVWMTDVLAGYEDATSADVRGCRRFVGTSAGACSRRLDRQRPPRSA